MENNNYNNENKNYFEKPFTNYHQSEYNNNHFETFKDGEVTYTPTPEIPLKNTKKRMKNFFKALGVIAAAIIISVGSVAGYISITDNGANSPFNNNESSLVVKEDDTNEETTPVETTEATVNDNLPTLTQLAAKENALPVTQIVKKVTPAVVGISCETFEGTATGTGIIMSEDGYIITNNHVIDGANEISVAIKNGDDFDEYDAKLIGRDAQTDLAVIKIDETGLTPAKFGVSDNLQVGELAIAIGNPLGFDFASTVTAGIISGLNREINIESRQMTLIQTDAAINRGNSGGPLVNSYGQVIGINSAKISQQYAEGLGFAIPIDAAKPIIDDLIQYGYVKGRPMIGITGEDVTAQIALWNDIPQGVFVRYVAEGSGAEKAGIQSQDIIIGVDGNEITSMAELNNYKNEHEAGDTLTLHIYRKGLTFDVEVTLTESTPVNN